MNTKLLTLHSFFILFGVGISALVLLPQGDTLQIPLIGALTFLYLLLTIHRNPFKKRVGTWHDGPTLAILSAIVLILILTTGGSESPLFFLLSFLLFSIGFVLIPEVIFVFLVGVLALFSTQLLTTISLLEMVNAGSLILFSPLAYFFGKIFQKESEEDEIKKEKEIVTSDATETIEQDVQEIIQTTPLSPEAKEKLEEITEATHVIKEASR